MANRKSDFSLSTLDDLFSSQEERDAKKNGVIREIPLELIDGFPNHPFKVKDDEEMFKLVESVKTNGVLTPAILRPKENGRYEMVSGHRRKRACELAQMDTIRCEVRDLTDDEATILMVESNYHRPEILPSEKAFAYKMRLEAMNRQGKRSDLTSTPLVSKSRSNEALGDWTLVNNNGASKGSIFNDLSLANDGLVKAWEVMKPSEYGIGNTLFNGPNGSLEEAYLISAYNLDGQSYPDNDDWLISPELPGIAQEISFAIGALDVQYGPSSYEVLVSSTDSEIASFTKVAEGTLTSAGWNSVTAQLPEGTKYFAIRNNTSGDGAMCVMLGDIKFTANSSATVASFNIYYNNEKIATVDGDKTTYTVAADKVELEGVSAKEALDEAAETAQAALDKVNE